MRIIAGSHKNRLIEAPKGLATRPTMGMLREALFNICQNRIDGAAFLDLFAGSGAMGLEALSRGAARAVFVDLERESTRCITENLRHLGLVAQAQVLQGDVLTKMQHLEKMGQVFDIIYVDPPYRQTESSYGEKVLLAIDEGLLLRPGGLLFIEGPHPLQLHVEGLKTLQLEKERRMGRATLQQYKKD